MPITLTGLQALSVEMPTTVSTGSAVLADRADDVLRPADVGLHRLEGEIFAGGHLFERGGVEHHVGFPERRGDGVRNRARRRCKIPAARRK